MTGLLAWRCSEDGGATWSERFQTPIGRGALDHPDEAVPSNWVTSGWQTPLVTSCGEVICPVTRWASRAQGFLESFAEQEHEGWFLRFDNILTEPDPAKLVVTTLPEGNRGIRLDNPVRPGYSAAMEPAICSLSDGRIMCLIRTVTGSLYYSLSADGARSWSDPQELCFEPGGRPVLHPNAPVTFAALRDGRYVLLFHNNDGTANGGEGPQDSKGRRPVFLSVGREIDDPGGQPLAFDAPRELYDNGGPSRPYSGSLALYGTFFEYEGQRYLWYADAMRFLLGRLIPDELLDAPGAGWAPSLNLPRGGPS